MDINKLPPGVREALRERGVKEAVVAIMSPREVFEEYCNWNGIINWSDTLWDTMTALQAQAQPAPVPQGEAFPRTFSGGELTKAMGFPAPVVSEGSADLLLTLEQAAARVEIANKEGNPILSAWLPDAQAVIKREKARLAGAPASSPLSVAGAPVPKADGESRKVVVVLTGGIVDQVLVGEEGLSVAVIDYDKNADLDDLVVIPQPDGTNQYALTGIHEPEVNPARVDELYAAVEEAKPAAEDDESLRARP